MKYSALGMLTRAHFGTKKAQNGYGEGLLTYRPSSLNFVPRLVDQEVDLALAWTTVCRAARHDRQSTWLWHPQCRFNQHELGAVTG